MLTALHKGDERTRELELWVDDVEWVTGWTSSGTTTGFEEILMPTSGIVGEVVTIRAVLDEDEWISITEVGRLSGVVLAADEGVLPWIDVVLTSMTLALPGGP